jgi:hypothetical protein
MKLLPKGFRKPRPLFFAAVIAACVLIGWLGVSFARPFLLAADMSRENARLEKRSLDLKFELQRLRKRNAFVKTDAGMELEARRKGYVKPDERPLIIPDQPGDRRDP